MSSHRRKIQQEYNVGIKPGTIKCYTLVRVCTKRAINDIQSERISVHNRISISSFFSYWKVKNI